MFFHLRHLLAQFCFTFVCKKTNHAKTKILFTLWLHHTKAAQAKEATFKEIKDYLERQSENFRIMI